MAFNPGSSDGKQSGTFEHADTPIEPQEMEGSMVKPLTATDKVLYSDIGISTLLVRLKQSIASARDFAGFLKKRSSLEEDHAQGLRKMTKANYEAVQRQQENRQGTYAAQLTELTRVHERMADHGMQFALSLHQMNEDLTNLANDMDRGRKHWKQEGLNNEKKVKDAEGLLDKAKTRYYGLAEKYDRARTGDTSGKVFGIKGPKSAAQHEEDLYRQVQGADTDYQGKVQAAQVARQENINSLRPQAIKALQDLITECDSALVLQLQKFAAFNEKLLVGNGLLVSPIKLDGEDKTTKQSMREMVNGIDNEKDFHSYIASHSNMLPPRPVEIKYEKHPTLAQSQPQVPMAQPPTTQSTTTPIRAQPPQISVATSAQPPQSSSSASGVPPPQSFGYQPSKQDASTPSSFRGPPSAQRPASAGTGAVANGSSPTYNSASMGSRGGMPSPLMSHAPNGPSALQSSTLQSSAPTRPMFGMTLENLFRRDEHAVPPVVEQCINAVDLFGLDVEGIYRLSGNSSHINELKRAFDYGDATRTDFRNPANFHHDINSVAGLLKQFFRDLPEPLMTSENYAAFIEAGRIDNDEQRRDTLHAIINNLPDPNYATLRAVTLHLHRIQERSATNRMTSQNLAICFAPTIMGPHTGAYVADSGLQARVLDTILCNTFAIFDED